MMKKLKEFKKQFIKNVCSFIQWITMGKICLGHCNKATCNKKKKKS